MTVIFAALFFARFLNWSSLKTMSSGWGCWGGGEQKAGLKKKSYDMYTQKQINRQKEE